MASDSTSSSSDSAYDSAADHNPNSDTPINNHDSAIDDHLTSLTLTPLDEDLAPEKEREIEETDQTPMPEIGVTEVEEEAADVLASEVVVEEERESNSVSATGDVGLAWREEEVEAPASPGSSGYAGERGSSNASSASGIEEIGEDQVAERDGGLVNGVADSQPAWIPGKRHVNEVSFTSNLIF